MLAKCFMYMIAPFEVRVNENPKYQTKDLDGSGVITKRITL